MFAPQPAAFMFQPSVAPSAPQAIAQTHEFTAALRLAGEQPLVLEELNNMVVMQRRVRGIPLAMINRAPFLQAEQILDAVKAEGLRHRPLILSPDHPVPELARLGALPLMTPAQIALLDIHPDRDARRASLEQKWRNRLRHAEAQGLKVTRRNLPSSANHWLLQADLAQQGHRGYRSWPIPLTLAYAEANPSAAKLFEAHEGREVIAGVLILTHGHGATYHVAYSTARGKHLSAHNLLMWSVMEWLAGKAITTLDLGVINTEAAAGLARFKLGTGARLHRLGGTWIYWPPLGRSLAGLARWDRALMAS